ncbi:MAG: nucleotidyl transferase AbiEii/AbiGii toxin family protein [Deltaproteobacteria bacterium]|nr:nucleotidyl transferase AbiEii/AbiGii toxin family protein [Deltaproteobacteria bacterium]
MDDTVNTDILTSLQRNVLVALFSDPWFREHFYLTGGTALAAFYLKHRYSDDLDFFTHQNSLDSIPELMRMTADRLGLSVIALQRSPGFLRYELNGELKVDFVVDVSFRVGEPASIDALMIDSMNNIAVNKVCAILGRLDAKDYVDLFFIQKEHQFDIFELLRLGQQKDTGLDPFVWASLIAEVAQLAILPRMIRTISLEELISFSLKLRDDILDRIKPTH